MQPSRLLNSATLVVWVCLAMSAQGKDYFLTIGGGYSPQGNQASLEANVIFFQQLLARPDIVEAAHKIYFADGFDSGRDLQVLQRRAAKPTPTIKVLSDIFRLSSNDALIYRNHQVPNISGANQADEIHDGLNALASQLAAGDRLIIYVTAHGSAAKGGNNNRDTSISGWGNKPLKMSDFSSWLDQLPEHITVVSVMAQCYCGGFANTVFEAGDDEVGFARNVRCGFFAQQHDLPAAGCRPDVENDEEYSSYFWGAFLGRSRTGKPVANVDCNNDARISLAEAHAYAVVASETIDIPIRSSEAVLRRYSRIADYELEGVSRPAPDENYEIQAEADARNVAFLGGSLYEIAARGRPEETRIIVGLSEKLGIPLSCDVTDFTKRYEALRAELRDLRRVSSRRPRGSSPRRKLQEAVIARWPELKDPKSWTSTELLSADNQDAFLAELEEMEGYSDFLKSNDERVAAREASTTTELKQVKFRRLLHQLENIVLAQNIASVASPEIVDHYRRLVAAEESFLSSQ